MGIEERKEREKQSRIKAIRDAAKTVFFEKGFQSATMEEIAYVAEIARGTIYLYFKNKDDLFTSILFEGAQGLRRRLCELEEALDDGKFRNSRELIAGFCEMDLQIYMAGQESLTLKFFQTSQLNNLVLSLSKENFDRVNQAGRENLTIARRIISKAIDRKIFPDVNPARIVDIFRAVFVGNVQIADARAVVTEKNFLVDNLEFSFFLLSKGIEALEVGKGAARALPEPFSGS